MQFVAAYCSVDRSAQSGTDLCASTELTEENATNILFHGTPDDADEAAKLDVAGDPKANTIGLTDPDTMAPPIAQRYTDLGDEQLVIGGPGVVVSYAAGRANLTSITLGGGAGSAGTCNVEGAPPSGKSKDVVRFNPVVESPQYKSGRRYSIFDRVKFKRWAYQGGVQRAKNAVGLIVQCAHGFATAFENYALKWHQYALTAIPQGDAVNTDSVQIPKFYWMDGIGLGAKQTTYSVSVTGNFGPVSVGGSISTVRTSSAERWDGDVRAAPKYRTDPVFTKFQQYTVYGYWESDNRSVHNTDRPLVTLGGWSYYHKNGQPEVEYIGRFRTCNRYGAC
jgi:hypothetical protein